MSDYIYQEMSLAVHSFALGLILMVSYDFLRLFRLFIPHGNWAVGLEDFVYCMYCGVMTFVLLFYENSGILRGYVVVCAFAAMVLYDRIVSRSVFGVLKKVQKWFTIKLITRKNRKETRQYGTEPK